MWDSRTIQEPLQVHVCRCVASCLYYSSTEHERGKMSMDYIRRTYDVPAKRGARILFLDTGGTTHDGVIVGSRGMYLRARFPRFTGRHIVTLHPTSNVRYLSNDQKGRK